MDNFWARLWASIICATLFCCMTVKTVGAMQQGGYKNRTFYRWLRRGDNMFFNRLAVLALCLALTTSVTAVAFSFLGRTWALVLSALPFLGLCGVFLAVDLKYALKVPIKLTGRFYRLTLVYLVFTGIICYGFIALLSFLAMQNGSSLYGVICYLPFAVMPILLPFILCAANGVTRIFENARNAKFVKRAGQVLDESDIIRIGVVGSFGKTSVKNILKSILSERYEVVQTPESYNTPIGIAKTVFSKDFDKKQILIAEMGARKAGDIAELCALVKPNYGVFTGVCEQHISSFKNLKNVFEEKSEIIQCGARVVCDADLREQVESAFGKELDRVIFAENTAVKDLKLSATQTRFILKLGEEEIEVQTQLLGYAAVENILLAATLAKELGLTAAEIATGIAKIEAVPHRLQLTQNGGVYILDDAYNTNPRGAAEALAALGRFEGRKCVVTPGIIECGVLEEKINGVLGRRIAQERLDLVILVGDTLVGAVKQGYLDNGGEKEKLMIARNLDEAKEELAKWLGVGDAVLFLNDLPDVY